MAEGADDMNATTHDDRENLLLGLRALYQQCRKIAKESRSLQTCTWKDQPVTVSWQLDFNAEMLVFAPRVAVRSHKTGHSSPSLRDLGILNMRIVNRLIHLKEHESWPVTIPTEWLEEKT
jgi:hypothetical protein